MAEPEADPIPAEEGAEAIAEGEEVPMEEEVSSA